MKTCFLKYVMLLMGLLPVLGVPSAVAKKQTAETRHSPSLQTVIKTAQPVRMSVPLGGKIRAGPHSVLIRPDNGKKVESITVDSNTPDFILGVTFRNGRIESAHLIEHIQERLDQVRLSGNGGPIQVVIPDRVGKRKLTDFINLVTFQHEGRTIVREIQSEEIIAYTSRDSLSYLGTHGIIPRESSRTRNPFSESVRPRRSMPTITEVKTIDAGSGKELANYDTGKMTGAYFTTATLTPSTFTRAGEKLTVQASAIVPEGAEPEVSYDVQLSGPVKNKQLSGTTRASATTRFGSTTTTGTSSSIQAQVDVTTVTTRTSPREGGIYTDAGGCCLCKASTNCLCPSSEHCSNEPEPLLCDCGKTSGRMNCPQAGVCKYTVCDGSPESQVFRCKGQSCNCPAGANNEPCECKTGCSQGPNPQTECSLKDCTEDCGLRGCRCKKDSPICSKSDGSHDCKNKGCTGSGGYPAVDCGRKGCQCAEKKGICSSSAKTHECGKKKCDCAAAGDGCNCEETGEDTCSTSDKEISCSIKPCDCGGAPYCKCEKQNPICSTEVVDYTCMTKGCDCAGPSCSKKYCEVCETKSDAKPCGGAEDKACECNFKDKCGCAKEKRCNNYVQKNKVIGECDNEKANKRCDCKKPCANLNDCTCTPKPRTEAPVCPEDTTTQKCFKKVTGAQYNNCRGTSDCNVFEMLLYCGQDMGKKSEDAQELYWGVVKGMAIEAGTGFACGVLTASSLGWGGGACAVGTTAASTYSNGSSVLATWKMLDDVCNNRRMIQCKSGICNHNCAPLNHVSPCKCSFAPDECNCRPTAQHCNIK